MEKKKTSYKLLSIDLDGTLLSPVLKTASKEDCKAIQEYMSLGGLAFINTGRPIWGVTKTLNRINKFGSKKIKLLSCCNGSYIKDFNDGKVYEKKLNHSVCLKLLDIVKKYRNVYILFYSARGFKKHIGELYPNNGVIRAFYKKSKLVKVQNWNDLTSYKVNIFSSSKKKIANIFQEMRKQGFDKMTTFSTSTPRFIEVTAKGVGKGHAIDLFAKKYKIATKEIVAIGDSFNDKLAFDKAGLSIGIAPENKFFLKHCDKVIDHKKNGVSDAIKTYVNKEDNIKLVFSDLDGTLIHPTTKLYSEKTKLALQQCTKKSMPLAIASGRAIYDIIAIVKKMKLDSKSDIYVAGNNGATIYDVTKKKYISEIFVDDKDAKFIFNYFVKLNATKEKGKIGLIIHTRSRDLLFYNQKFWKKYNIKKMGNENRYDPWVDRKPIYINKYPENIKCYKLIVKFATTELAHYYCDKMRKDFPNLEFCLSSNVNLEVNHKGVDKAFAAKQIAKVSNIKIDEMLILGDSQNDIPALKLNKNSYCPCYARDYVQKESGHVIKNVDSTNFAYVVLNSTVLKKGGKNGK